MQPTVITKLSEHFKSDADVLMEKYKFDFQVLAYRKISAGEMKQAFRIWRQNQKRKSIPKNKTITVQAIYGFDGY